MCLLTLAINNRYPSGGGGGGTGQLWGGLSGDGVEAGLGWAGVGVGWGGGQKQHLASVSFSVFKISLTLLKPDLPDVCCSLLRTNMQNTTPSETQKTPTAESVTSLQNRGGSGVG